MCTLHTLHISLTIIVKEIFACCYRAMCSNMFEVAIELFQSQNVLKLSSCLLQVLWRLSKHYEDYLLNLLKYQEKK